MNDDTQPVPIIQSTTPAPIIEPTTPAYSYNPYERTSPYYGYLPQIPPPPPTKRKLRRTIIVSVLVTFVIITSVLTFVFNNDKNASDLSATNHTKRVTTTPVPTQNTDYTAKTIVQAFQAKGLPTDFLQYDKNLNSDNQTARPLSTADFVDPSFCGGHPCDIGYVWLGVYPTVIDAQSAYSGMQTQTLQAEQNGQPVGSAIYSYQHGRCVIQGEPLTSVYILIITSDCI